MTDVKEKSLRFRVSERDDARLRAAARIVNESLTDFTLGPALQRADKLLAQADVTLIPAEQFDAMVAALDEPVTPIPQLADVAAKPRIFTRA